MAYTRPHFETPEIPQNYTSTPELPRREQLARWVGPVACYGAAVVSAVIAYNGYAEGDVPAGVIGGMTAAMFAIVGTGWRKIENYAASQPLKNMGENL